MIQNQYFALEAQLTGYAAAHQTGAAGSNNDQIIVFCLHVLTFAGIYDIITAIREVLSLLPIGDQKLTDNSQTSLKARSLNELLGAAVVSAQSSLNSFGITFDNDLGLVLEAMVEEGDLMIGWKIIPAKAMPRLSEAVCSVDWSWIYGKTLDGFERGDSFRLELAGIGKITVSVGAWQGKPFLSFMPYKPPGT